LKRFFSNREDFEFFFSKMLLSEQISENKKEKPIMSEKEEEQPSITVKDRRKFNLDGSMREGFEAEPEVPAEVRPTPQTEVEDVITESAELEPEAESEEMPGADNPASFVNFLSTLATNAAAALGAMPNPATGKRAIDLETGKFWLEVLGMLKEKTEGNLHKKEQEILDTLLSDLRMQYVQIMRIAEERLKQQAAQKFSANDLLGKK
jgi:hypothetical protein